MSETGKKRTTTPSTPGGNARPAKKKASTRKTPRKKAVPAPSVSEESAPKKKPAKRAARKKSPAKPKTTTASPASRKRTSKTSQKRTAPAAASGENASVELQTATKREGKGTGKRWPWRVFKCCGILLLLFLTLSSLWIITYRYVNPPLTPLMILRHVQEEEDVRKRWRDYKAVSPEFLLAVVAAEDQRFFEHHGFDFRQIKAAIETKLDGGRLRGGSTISQQVAKNVFLWPNSSWLRKGLEVWFTVGIELCWSKQRILEVYVNIAEMGEGIYGVEAAAQHYYHKPASDLTRAESAMLAAILPAPRDRSPLHPTEYLRQRQAWIVQQMYNLGGTRYLDQPRS